MAYDKENFKNIFEHSFTWLGGFMRNVRRYKNKTAVMDPGMGKSWTYGELNADVNRLANGLLKAGVGKGDVVMYQLYNSPQFVMCYIAPQKLGAINSPQNINYSAGESARIIDRDRPKAYIFDCDCQEMADKALELAHYKPELVLAVDYHERSPKIHEGHMYFREFISMQSDEAPETDFVPDMYDEVTILGTSGTTGTPKAVPLNNVNEVMSAHDAIMHFPIAPQDVTMNMTPWFHRGGLHSGGPAPTLYAGAALVVMRLFSAKTTFDYVEKYGVTFLIGVPSALTTLAARQERHFTDISHLKGIVTMGSPLDKTSCMRFQEMLTPNIFNGYGTTETFWNTFLRPADLPDMAGAAGISCTDDDVRIVNIYEDKKADPDDTVPMDGKTQGEIIIFAPNKSALCYSENPEQSAERYKDGWYYTKDIGTWDENSYVTICGRKDDMIICMGENIYPAQLEEVLNRHPKVKDSMVVPVPDEKRGQAVCAYIVSDDKTLNANEMNHYCVESNDLPAFKCPRYYAFVDELPYNAAGKKQHAVLRGRAADDLANGILTRPKINT